MDTESRVTVDVEFRSLPLEQLRPSTTEAQTQRRKYFDKIKLDELVESVAARGIVQPIVVRKVNGEKAAGVTVPGYYEIVAGERRFLASQLAKRETIPAVVLELTDEEVIEVQLIENLQREDVHPMQEAEGYHELVETHGHSVDELPGKLGKSRSYVYARIKLLALCAAAREAFYKGDLNPSTALLIARIPGDDQQERALKQITEKRWDGDGLRMSYREAQRYVHDTFMLKLSTAPFPRDDATLVPSAGACGPCPMRSGNARELFGDVTSADVCTNPTCFKAKKAAHVKRELDKAKADGTEVIRGNAAKRILPDSRYTMYAYGSDGAHKQLRNGYARPSDKCLDDPKKRTYAELAGKDAPKVLLQNPETGRVEKVFKLDDIRDRMKDKGVTAKVGKDREEVREIDRERVEQDRKREIAARAAIFRAVVAAAPKKLDRYGTTALIFHAFGQIYLQDEDCEVLGWDKPPNGNQENWILAQLAERSEAELAQLALAITVLEDVTQDYGKAEHLERLAKHLGVDTKKIRRDLAPKEEKKPKADAKKKKGKR